MTEEVRLVVVDDSVDIADALSIALRMDGYAVRTAYDGREALAVIEAHHPHAVILDVDMPEVNGHELTRRLRARYGNDVVLVAMSGHREDERTVEATFKLVDHYFQKPFDLAEMSRIFPPLQGSKA